MRGCRRTPRRPTTCSWRSSLRRGARCPSSSSRPTTPRVCSPPPPLFVCGPSDGLRRAPAAPDAQPEQPARGGRARRQSPVVRAPRACVGDGGDACWAARARSAYSPPAAPTDRRLPRRVVCVAPSDRKRSRADRCYFFNIFCGRRRDGRRCDEQTGGGGGIVARSTASCVAPRWGRERGRRSGVRVAMAMNPLQSGRTQSFFTVSASTTISYTHVLSCTRIESDKTSTQ